ncbi:hypothetical protein KIN20_016372 [Parelaphostrongylus tenuis]|uniref:Uncharacterized protein n=1 Tax=Parelaphostrongylus tenuis TaxID=148309 RepID=A0AAD5MGC9_PARTN|nr:hypothetical protein KIN20_016372 [Parelaphostrongylus tenuis]
MSLSAWLELRSLHLHGSSHELHYDAPLAWNQIWCNTTTPVPTELTTTVSTTSMTPLMKSTSTSVTATTHRQIQVIANYSMLYFGVFDNNCLFTEITVNVITLLTPDDVMQVMFEIPRDTTSCASFMVNNKKCEDKCVHSLIDYGDHITLCFAEDVDNQVRMVRDFDSTVQIRYNYCQQPMRSKGVSSDNVSLVLNETLRYAGARNNLSSIEIQEITVILNKSVNLKGLQAKQEKLQSHRIMDSDNSTAFENTDPPHLRKTTPNF